MQISQEVSVVWLIGNPTILRYTTSDHYHINPHLYVFLGLSFCFYLLLINSWKTYIIQVVLVGKGRDQTNVKRPQPPGHIPSERPVQNSR